MQSACCRRWPVVVLGVPRAFGLPFAQVAMRAAAFCKLVIFTRICFRPQPEPLELSFFRRILCCGHLPARTASARRAGWLLPRPSTCCQNLVRAARRVEPPAVETLIRQRAGEPWSTSYEVTAARGRIDTDATALSKSWHHSQPSRYTAPGPTPDVEVG